MKYAIIALFLLTSLLAWAHNEIDLLKTNEDVHQFLIGHVSRREFKDASPFEGSKVLSFSRARNTFYKVDIDQNGETDLVVDGQSALLVVMASRKRYRLYHLDTSLGYVEPTNLIAIDSIMQPHKLIVQRQERKIDTLILRFKGFIEYRPAPDSNLILDSLVWNTYWNGDLTGQVKVYRNLSVIYTRWYESGKPIQPIQYSGNIPRNTYNSLVELLQYMRPQQMVKSYNNGWSHTDHCRTFISCNGKTVEIDDFGGDGTFGLRQLYDIMHTIPER